ncbi:LDH2 family malate/lactate/ureidoglycolate dehydrogenase [Paraburkholderia sp. RAU6.4a]|uniref:hypothetical protein n=1 Tax=Paraburkholderia sp. RAU6.4a TaxID=2991067 RepID=UPI003D1E522A
MIDPGALAGDDAYLSRVEALIEMMLMDDDVHLPGYRREQLAQAAYEEGVEIPDALIAQLEGRA